jgi:hypothetical protein
MSYSQIRSRIPDPELDMESIRIITDSDSPGFGLITLPLPARLNRARCYRPGFFLSYLTGCHHLIFCLNMIRSTPQKFG